MKLLNEATILCALAYKGPWGTQPDVVLADSELLLLSRLKDFFGISKPEIKTIEALEKELEQMGWGYHGSPDYSFKIVKPFATKLS